MAGERTYPILPCADLDEALVFYQALGFSVSFRQRRPNPYAVVELEDIAIHLAAIDGFDPSGSYGSAIITVPDPGQLWESFRDGLRDGLGAVPTERHPAAERSRPAEELRRGEALAVTTAPRRTEGTARAGPGGGPHCGRAAPGDTTAWARMRHELELAEAVNR